MLKEPFVSTGHQPPEEQQSTKIKDCRSPVSVPATNDFAAIVVAPNLALGVEANDSAAGGASCCCAVASAAPCEVYRLHLEWALRTNCMHNDNAMLGMRRPNC